MRDILIIGLIIAVVIILIRIMFGTPLVKRVMESFTSSAMVNTVTECPMGTEMYMHEGVVFCCSGKIRENAISVADTCVARLQDMDNLTFCTLGASRGNIPNCSQVNDKVFKAEGARVCPPSAPNYARGPPGSATANGRCCPGPTNAARTDCMSTVGSCDATPPGTSIMKSAQPSCQLLKLKEGEGACPSSYIPTMMLASEPSGPLAFHGLNIPRCTNLMTNKTCMTKPVIGAIKQIKATEYDPSLLKELDKLKMPFDEWSNMFTGFLDNGSC